MQAAAGKEARAEAEQLLGQLKGVQTDLSRTQSRLDKEQAAGDAFFIEPNLQQMLGLTRSEASMNVGALHVCRFNV